MWNFWWLGSDNRKTESESNFARPALARSDRVVWLEVELDFYFLFIFVNPNLIKKKITDYFEFFFISQNR